VKASSSREVGMEIALEVGVNEASDRVVRFPFTVPGLGT